MILLTGVANLSQWQTFYEIVGCSGGSLVGLQFVVIALIANSRIRADSGAINAFGTPNVVHFAAVVTLSALMSAAWPSLKDAALAVGLCGIFGLAYSANVFRRARHQTAYQPVLEDWLFYAILPCLLYTALILASVCMLLAAPGALFLVASVALGLLLTGIRNSWDSVTHVVAGGIENDRPGKHAGGDPGSAGQPDK